ncbi:hypothetical protein BS47DRAFT_450226 [Hydnum rufescens UP504]|uniref:Uncharacterized protein n=1 Tax=Hydnum rufescens UP504 TaxID=1448309 RepID=A0A9P6E144_9AGAM|nr:hypothetical protein BS47DRAFT_450226 [Hydnum rufescens UP504]
MGPPFSRIRTIITMPSLTSVALFAFFWRSYALNLVYPTSLVAGTTYSVQWNGQPSFLFTVEQFNPNKTLQSIITDNNVTYVQIDVPAGTQIGFVIEDSISERFPSISVCRIVHAHFIQHLRLPATSLPFSPILFYRLVYPSHLSRSVFLLHPTCVPTVLNVSVVVGIYNGKCIVGFIDHGHGYDYKAIWFRITNDIFNPKYAPRPYCSYCHWVCHWGTLPDNFPFQML